MNRQQRLRRVILICCHFTRNMAHYRAGWSKKRLVRNTDFWRGVNGNFIDIAILEWCKLFADKRGAHYWKKIVSDQAQFEISLTEALGPGTNIAGFDLIVNSVKTYRDKFVAHLDDELVADVPGLDDCWRSVECYHRYLISTESSSHSFSGLPKDLNQFYKACLDEAKAEYGAD